MNVEKAETIRELVGVVMILAILWAAHILQFGI
jgi:hypothetical protein